MNRKKPKLLKRKAQLREPESGKCEDWDYGEKVSLGGNHVITFPCISPFDFPNASVDRQMRKPGFIRVSFVQMTMKHPGQSVCLSFYLFLVSSSIHSSHQISIISLSSLQFSPKSTACSYFLYLKLTGVFPFMKKIKQREDRDAL